MLEISSNNSTVKLIIWGKALHTFTTIFNDFLGERTFYFYRANVILILPYLINIERLENPFLSSRRKHNNFPIFI